MLFQVLLYLAFATQLITPDLSGATATKTKTQVTNNSGVTPFGLCGAWVKEPDGGYFTSPNYPQKYPPERECIYIIEGRYCGQESPMYVRSTGRYLYIKFVADGELEAIGFSARYNFTQDPEFKDLGELPALPLCEFELNGPEGFVESIQITREKQALLTEAVDCRWFVRAPPKAKIYMRFLEYEMHNSNECKRNFVAIYDGNSSVEHLKNKFCSTVANDVMLTSSLGVVRLWADEGSRKSRFKILFTTFLDPPCEGDTFFCHSNMCINHTLVCNGIQNCVYPWDENHCKEKRKPSILDSLDNTNITIIAVTCGLVVILLIISVIIQVKQPRKKYIIRRDDFDPALLHPGLEPPHYELCTLRHVPSGDLTDAALCEEFDKSHKLHRSSSKCIRDHHCGSQQGSMHGSVQGSRSNLSMREATIDPDCGALVPQLPGGIVSQQSPRLSHHMTPAGHRNILVMKHSYSQDGGNGYREDDDDDLMIDDGPTTSRHHIHHHQIHHGIPGFDHTVHRTLSNDF
ncbi:neuropilin and tolloid-like protein 1 isoform X2 [Corythoichthys intestinalis]|uniref:neuropilin and tolloid-like protein 1 isoform X2 n=1 Tax=Corythoichthys intestinalis TaxID=161448 RepID=UPI0025A4EFF5|nr:neuropilin and tolloid-like protein 1 isoform X2 [Corythoichthys intestinalis]